MADPVVHIYDPDFRVDPYTVNTFSTDRFVLHLSRGDGTCDVWEIRRWHGIGGNTHRSLGVGTCREAG